MGMASEPDRMKCRENNRKNLFIQDAIEKRVNNSTPQYKTGLKTGGEESERRATRCTGL